MPIGLASSRMLPLRRAIRSVAQPWPEGMVNYSAVASTGADQCVTEHSLLLYGNMRVRPRVQRADTQRINRDKYMYKAWVTALDMPLGGE